MNGRNLPRSEPQRGASPVLWLAAVGLALFGIYLLTRSQSHLWDAIAYVARVVDDPLLCDRYLSTCYFHPHHLFYVPFAKGFYLLFKGLGIGEDPFLPLQFANSLLGGGCVFLTGLLVLRVTGDFLPSLMTAAGIGVSNGLWCYSTSVEVMVPAMFFALLGLFILMSTRALIGWAAAGLAFSASILLHQISVLIAGVLTFVLLLGLLRSRVRPRNVFVFAGSWVGATGFAYLAVAFWDQGATSVGDVMRWLLTVRSRSSFSGMFLPQSLYTTAKVLPQAFVSLDPLFDTRGVGLLSRSRILDLLAMAVPAAGMAFLWLASLPGTIRALRRRDLITWGIILGVAVIAAFVIWFQPWNTDYWVYLLPLVWGAIGLHIPVGRAPQAASRGRKYYLWASVIVVSIVGLGNLHLEALPARQPDNASYRDLVQFASGHFKSGDLFVSDLGMAAIPFFVGVEVFPPPTEGRADEEARFRARIRSALERTTPDSMRIFLMQEDLTRVEACCRTELDARPIGDLRGRAVLHVFRSRAGGAEPPPRETVPPSRERNRH